MPSSSPPPTSAELLRASLPMSSLARIAPSVSQNEMPMAWPPAGSTSSVKPLKPSRPSYFGTTFWRAFSTTSASLSGLIETRPIRACMESSLESLCRNLLLGGRADDAVVAERAQVRRRLRLEVVGHDPVGDLGHRAAHALELLLGVPNGHAFVVEHVVVALRRGLEAPCLARAHLVERQLHVLAQLALGLGLAGLVVDQLVAAVGQAVDSVH